MPSAPTILGGRGVVITSTLALVVDAEGEDMAFGGEGDGVCLPEAHLDHYLVLEVRHMTCAQRRGRRKNRGYGYRDSNCGY